MPVPDSEKKITKILSLHKNIVFMKISKNFDLLKKKLENHDLQGNSYILSRCGQDDEYFTEDLEFFSDKKIPYLSLLIVKK